jgi:RNA polymerase sigma-70 factor (ECF subfamily)
LNQETDLIKKLQNQIDDTSFKALVSPYLKLSFSIIIRIVKDKFTAEDVLQEALIVVLKSIKNFRFESSFKTWFAKISYNQALQYIRSNIKYSKHYDFSELEGAEDIISDSSDVEASILKDLNKNELWLAIDDLDDKYKTVLLLFYKEELSIKEISEIMSIKLNHVKVLLHRAREELKNKLLKNL